MKQQTRTRAKKERCARSYDWEEGSNNGALGKKEAASGYENVPQGRDSTAEAWLHTVGAADGGWARRGPGTAELQELGISRERLASDSLDFGEGLFNLSFNEKVVTLKIKV